MLRLLYTSKSTDSRQQIYTSMDAGHYVADFAYYCSLAEAGRSKYENGRGYKAYDKESRGTTVLLMHCPPVGQPLSSDEVTDAIKRMVSWIALHR
jgi:pyroglutamyl-peptidase